MKVIYRKDKLGNVIAFLPEIPANTGIIMCYEHIGQHGEASLDYYLALLPANPCDYEELHRELCTIYESLTICKRR